MSLSSVLPAVPVGPRAAGEHVAAVSKTPSVPALERALAILEVVSASRSGLTFSQIASRLAFPKSSIHCLLVTFERQGYLRRSESTGRYLCGTRLIHIAQAALEGIALREQATPILSTLAQRTGMTAHLAILEGGEVTLAARAERPGAQRVATWVGKRVDVHCTAMGKCLAAYLPEAELERMVHGRGLLRHNENTICSLSRLKQELAKTREQGFGIDDEEEEIGIRCLGVPVFDWDGRVIAALSLSGPVEYLEKSQWPSLIGPLKSAAAEVARQMGRRQVTSAEPPPDRGLA